MFRTFRGDLGPPVPKSLRIKGGEVAFGSILFTESPLYRNLYRGDSANKILPKVTIKSVTRGFDSNDFWSSTGGNSVNKILPKATSPPFILKLHRGIL